MRRRHGQSPSRPISTQTRLRRRQPDGAHELGACPPLGGAPQPRAERRPESLVEVGEEGATSLREAGSPAAEHVSPGWGLAGFASGSRSESAASPPLRGGRLRQMTRFSRALPTGAGALGSRLEVGEHRVESYEAPTASEKATALAPLL